VRERMGMDCGGACLAVGKHRVEVVRCGSDERATCRAATGCACNRVIPVQSMAVRVDDTHFNRRLQAGAILSTAILKDDERRHRRIIRSFRNAHWRSSSARTLMERLASPNSIRSARVEKWLWIDFARSNGIVVAVVLAGHLRHGVSGCAPFP